MFSKSAALTCFSCLVLLACGVQAAEDERLFSSPQDKKHCDIASLKLEGTVISAACSYQTVPGDASSFGESSGGISTDLNAALRNDQGKLVVDHDGGFISSCDHPTLSGSVIGTTCVDPAGHKSEQQTIDLNNYLQWEANSKVFTWSKTSLAA